MIKLVRFENWGFWCLLVLVNGFFCVVEMVNGFFCVVEVVNGFLVLKILINGFLFRSNSFSGFAFFILIAAILILKEDAECNVRHQMFKKNCEKNNGGTNNNKKEKDCRDKKNWTSFGTLIIINIPLVISHMIESKFLKLILK